MGVGMRGGDEREIIGPLLSADGCARAHKHTHTAHTRTDDTRGSGGHLGFRLHTRWATQKVLITDAYI